jgi:aspartate-semialdehyde dehydrogenase
MKIPVVILGATGSVGQHFISLLNNHPWFEIKGLYASKHYKKFDKRWIASLKKPEWVDNYEVFKIDTSKIIDSNIKIAFSALPAIIAKDVEKELVSNGVAVFSNASSYRMDPQVPIMIPEINGDHLNLSQNKTPLITNSNCTTSGLALSLAPLKKLGIKRVNIASYQALSGAGYYGVSAIEILGNVIPYISGEEEKLATEPKKILGKLENGKIIDYKMDITAHCVRVNVEHGHLEAIFIETEKETTYDEVFELLSSFKGQEIARDLPSTPEKPLVVFKDPSRPQPKLDIHLGNGMGIGIGTLKVKGKFISFKMLVNNVIRGAAGGSIQNAELAYKQGYIK